MEITDNNIEVITGEYGYLESKDPKYWIFRVGTDYFAEQKGNLNELKSKINSSLEIKYIDAFGVHKVFSLF